VQALSKMPVKMVETILRLFIARSLNILYINWLSSFFKIIISLKNTTTKFNSFNVVLLELFLKTY